MKKEIINISKPKEFEIDVLLDKFNKSLDETAGSISKQNELSHVLSEFNPRYIPVDSNGLSLKEFVMEQIVAGIYAPLIHGFSKTIISNIYEGNLPNVVVSPPRDAIPLAVSFKQMSKQMGNEIKVLTPPLNRNTAGIDNNQKVEGASMDPLFPLMTEQLMKKLSGSLLEVETGIYGTTSLVLAKLLKEKGLKLYVPVKFYGLGPNLSFVHAILSKGESWIAEEAESKGLVDSDLIKKLMVFVDSLEEFGMQNFYHSVEKLQMLSTEKVVPVIMKQTQEVWSLAYASNMAVKNSASEYTDITAVELGDMLRKIPWLVEQSKLGLPLTLESEIPPMDSKEDHYQKIRESKVFDYPKNLVI